MSGFQTFSGAPDAEQICSGLLAFKPSLVGVVKPKLGWERVLDDASKASYSPRSTHAAMKVS